MKRKILILLTATLLVGCGNNNANEVVESQMFDNLPKSVNAFVGEKYQINPIANKDVKTDNNFKFVVKEGTSLTSVDSDGLVNFYYPGKSVVSIYLDENYNGVKDSNENYQNISFEISDVAEKVEATSIYIPSSAIDAFPGSTYDIDATLLPENSTCKKLKYISSNPDVSTIDENGKFKNTSVGDTILTVYNDANNNNQLDEDEVRNYCFVSVRNPETARTISLSYNNVTLKVGETCPIPCSISPSDTGLFFGFESLNKEVATVGSNKNNVGYVRGVFPGTTSIEVRCDGAFAYFNVTVVYDKINNVNGLAKLHLNEDSVIMNVGEKHTVSYRAIPSDANLDLTYSSNNNDVVTIDQNGEITAVGQGSAVVNIKDARGVSASVLVAVKGTTTYEGTYYNDYYKDLQWEDSDDLVSKLHTIINNGFYNLPYKSSSKANWETNIYADEDINDTTMVNAIYSDDGILKENHGNTKGYWQREHCIASTLLVGLGTGDATNKAGRASDFHNLYAALGSGNSARGNKNFGNADVNSPSYSDATSYSYDRSVFEPNDIDKGKVARAIFYMNVMYNDYGSMEAKETWTFRSAEDVGSHSKKSTTVTYSLGLKPVGITEKLIEYDRVDISTFLENASPSINLLSAHYEDILIAQGTTLQKGTDEYRTAVYSLYANDYSANSIGNLSTLIEWNSFAVDAQEAKHCESVYSHVGEAAPILGKKQGNRNPFVDYPELVSYIYGPLKDEPGNIKQLKPSVL